MVPGDNEAVRRFWEDEACGIRYGQGADAEATYRAMERTRYVLEPYVPGFAEFENYKGKEILELGVGAGTDFSQFIRGGAVATGVDLTDTAIEHTVRRLQMAGYAEDAFRLQRADVEDLPFPDDSFDLVYSWGVLHHSPDPPRAIKEVWRVLRPGGVARVMIYHRHSIVGRLLWTRYALLGLKPWTTLDQIYADRLESPGTKAYAIDEARRMFSAFQECGVQIRLSSGDLLEAHAGQRHRGALLGVAQRVWPRRIIRRWFPHAGLFMLIRAQK